MENYTYLDIYRNVVKNKELFEAKGAEFFDVVVKKEWVDGGKRKLNCINRNESSAFIGGNNLDKLSFHWFLGTDLFSCDKYISRSIMNGWDVNDFKMHDFDRAITTKAEWGSISMMDFGKHALDPDINRYRGSSIRLMGDTVVDLLSLYKISDIFSDGFNKWVGKNRRDEHMIPRVISNKMQFILWKKAIKKEKMSKRHLDNLTKGAFGKWTLDAYNELYKVEGLKEKKYFQEKISKTWFRDVKNCNFELAKTKIELLAKYKFGKSVDWQENQVIEYVENVDLSTSDMTGAEFVKWVINSGVLNRVRFKERENSYFKKELFVKHLESLYLHK